MKLRILLCTLACTFIPVALSAQGLPSNAGLDAMFLKLFGDVKSFAADGEVRISDAQDKETWRLPVKAFYLSGKMRTEIDLGSVKSALMPADATKMLKSVGMDKMVSIVGVEPGATLLVYPGLQAYVAMPNPPGTTNANDTKMERQSLGKETLDGRTTEKSKVTFTDGKGEKHEALVWTAPDLQNFPVQTRMVQDKQTVLLRFQTPDFKAVDADKFALPQSYTRHESMEKLTQAAMMKMISSGAFKK